MLLRKRLFVENFPPKDEKGYFGIIASGIPDQQGSLVLSLDEEALRYYGLENLEEKKSMLVLALEPRELRPEESWSDLSPEKGDLLLIKTEETRTQYHNYFLKNKGEVTRYVKTYFAYFQSPNLFFKMRENTAYYCNLKLEISSQEHRQLRLPPTGLEKRVFKVSFEIAPPMKSQHGPDTPF